MEPAPDDSAEIQACIERLTAEPPEIRAEARDELMKRACVRLTNLTRAMLRDFPGVHRWEDTDDVFQNAAIRLCSALKTVTPRTVHEFFSLGAMQIRRELIDLARHYYGPEGHGANQSPSIDQAHSSIGYLDPQQSTFDPGRLAMWSEFHQHVNELPDESRETFDLLWYQGLSQATVAQMLGVTERTVQRRWQTARLAVHKVMRGNLPGQL